MDQWIKLAKREVGDNKYPTLTRIKVGRVIMGIVAAPLGTSVLFPVATALMLPLTPSVWAKSKMIQLNEWRRLRI